LDQRESTSVQNFAIVTARPALERASIPFARVAPAARIATPAWRKGIESKQHQAAQARRPAWMQCGVAAAAIVDEIDRKPSNG
jgi:hypothetical protein